MHTRNFLHRDIKPDNLLLGIKEKSHIVYLVDMGLAKKFMKEGRNRLIQVHTSLTNRGNS